MRHIKKLASIMLALAMVFTMAVGAFATNPDEGQPEVTATTPSIVLENARYGETYNVYRIFELSYSSSNGVMAFTYFLPEEDPANPGQPNPFDGFFIGENAVGREWFNVNENTRAVTAKSTLEGEVTVYNFANALMKYIEDNNISSYKSVTMRPRTETDTKDGEAYTFEVDKLGYYLVDTSVAAVCALNSNHTTMTVKEKAPHPNLDKEVKEDSTGHWGSFNNDDTSVEGKEKTIEFRTTLKNMAKLENAILHDTMSDGLTFVEGSVKVYIGDESTGTLVEPSVLNSDGTTTVNYTVTTGENCTFEIHWDDRFLSDLAKSDVLTVTYKAWLDANNPNVVFNLPGNDNETYLKYGNAQETNHDNTTTYTYEIPVLKYYNNNKEVTENGSTTLVTEEIPLAGAQFIIFRNAGDSTAPRYQVALVNENGIVTEWVDEGNDFAVTRTNVGTGTSTFNQYTVSKYPEAAVQTSSEVTKNNDGSYSGGTLAFKGLDEGTYYLYEVKAPEGFNPLNNAIVTEIQLINGDPTKIEIMSNNLRVEEGTVRVENSTGSLLPSTGGMGTTIFYVVGSILVVGAAVLMVTKRRMGKNI